MKRTFEIAVFRRNMHLPQITALPARGIRYNTSVVTYYFTITIDLPEKARFTKIDAGIFLRGYGIIFDEVSSLLETTEIPDEEDAVNQTVNV